MAAPDSAFYYQGNRYWTNRALYRQWGQAWMLRALANLLLASPLTDRAALPASEICQAG